MPILAALALSTAVATAPIVTSPTCNKAVYLVVQIERLNRNKTKAYGEALRSSGIVRRFGGVYKAWGSPQAVLEGRWGTNDALIIERYPCREALDAMWNSDEYQNRIKPLRAGSGHYTITIFNEAE
jgi:uncharacterized protein (DUF1330 family)